MIRTLNHISLWTDEEKRAFFAAQKEWDDAQPESRIAALVALCEELLDAWLHMERACDERAANPERAHRATDERRDAYRARLARLKGEG